MQPLCLAHQWALQTKIAELIKMPFESRLVWIHGTIVHCVAKKVYHPSYNYNFNSSCQKIGWYTFLQHSLDGVQISEFAYWMIYA